MVREIKEYKKPGSVYPEVVIMDVRDILHGDYSVERLDDTGCGYTSVYCHHDLQKCIDKAEKLFSSLQTRHPPRRLRGQKGNPMKQANWFDDTFLPSLFEKWQNRDKQYQQIILTEAQAYQCSIRMEQKTSYSEFYGKSYVTGKEYSWRGRAVLLQQRCRYTFLSFGPTREETVAAAKAEEKRQHDRKLERLRKLRAKSSTLLDQYAADAQHRLEDARDWLLDEDSDADDIAFYTKQAKMAQEELDVCIG